MPKNFRRRNDSPSSGSEEENSGVKERIEDLKFLQKLRVRSSGVDANVLALGDAGTTSNGVKMNHDPWRLRTGGLVDMNRINDVVNNMNNNFAKETNQRDEDAEMQKFIEEQLRLKKSANALSTEKDAVSTEKRIKRPDDALFDVPKHLIENQSKHKSEETLSEQMLSGIPEVDLGVEERIRNIEETERAKQLILYGATSTAITTTQGKGNNSKDDSSVNFVQHKRYYEQNHDQNKAKNKKAKVKEELPTVGDTQKHELLEKGEKKNKGEQFKRPPNSKASDDYCLERFKKNMRHSRGTKIKIA